MPVAAPDLSREELAYHVELEELAKSLPSLEQEMEWAKRSPPPQSWFEEDAGQSD